MEADRRAEAALLFCGMSPKSLSLASRKSSGKAREAPREQGG
jgi:hypothetical protein